MNKQAKLKGYLSSAYNFRDAPILLLLPASSNTRTLRKLCCFRTTLGENSRCLSTASRSNCSTADYQDEPSKHDKVYYAQNDEEDQVGQAKAV